MADLDAQSTGEKIDIIAVGASGCETMDPAVFGLTGEFKDKVQMVISGDRCEIQMPEDCSAEEAASITEYASRLRFDGTMMIMGEDGKTYNLEEGKAFYKQVVECNTVPNVDIKVIGLSIKPTTLESAEIMYEIEQGNIGQFLARIHIFSGDAKVYSLDGEQFMQLYAGDQVLIDPAVLSAVNTGFKPVDNYDDADVHSGDFDGSGDATPVPGYKSSLGVVDAGCTTSPKHAISPDAMGAIFSVVFVMVMTAKYKERLKMTLPDVIAYAMSLSGKKNGEKSN